jgi:tetratricopeptide (TPR) repeat protein
MSLSRRWLLATTLALLVAAGPARADEQGEARRHYRHGERLFEAGRYADAAAAYERGYRLVRLPGFLIDMAHCHVRLGELEQARQLYRAFLEEAPTSPRRPEVERAIASIDDQLPVPLEAPSLPPLAPLTPRDRLHRLAALPLRTSDAPGAPALLLDRPPPPPPERRWLWPMLGGVAAGLLAGAAIVLLGRLNQDQGVKNGTIGTLTR